LAHLGELAVLLRWFGLALFLLPALGSGAAAQVGKYAGPPLGSDVCVAKFDTGSPSAAWDATATSLNVSCTGKYNYDNTWTFSKPEVYLQYLNPNTNGIRSGPSYTVTNESTLATPGTFANTFNNVSPPLQGEILQAFVRVTVTKQGQPNKTNSDTKAVVVPQKPPPPGGC
jgi:hypothetical protein